MRRSARASGSRPVPQPIRGAVGSNALAKAADARQRPRAARARGLGRLEHAPRPRLPPRQTRCGARRTAARSRRPMASGLASASKRPNSACRSGGISSTVPASTRSARPEAISSAPRPTAVSVPASRWTIVRLGPCAFVTIATCPAAALATLSANANGDTACGPSRRAVSSNCSVLVTGPNELDRTTPVRRASGARRRAPPGRAPFAWRPRRDATAGSCAGRRPAAPTATDRRRVDKHGPREAPGR